MTSLPRGPRIIGARRRHESIEERLKGLSRSWSEPSVDPPHPTHRLRHRQPTSGQLDFRIEITRPVDGLPPVLQHLGRLTDGQRFDDVHQPLLRRRENVGDGFGQLKQMAGLVGGQPAIGPRCEGNRRSLRSVGPAHHLLGVPGTTCGPDPSGTLLATDSPFRHDHPGRPDSSPNRLRRSLIPARRAEPR